MKSKKASSNRLEYAMLPIVILILSLGSARHASADEPYTLGSYIQDVRSKNQSFTGNQSLKSGARGRAREADLLFTPSVFANAQYGDDAKLSTIPIPGLSYSSIETQNYSLGINENTGFGLQAKIYYALDYTNYLGLPGGLPGFYDSRPVVELNQSLWQNGMGHLDQANETSIRAQADADFWNAEGGRENLEVNAEGAYWRLVIARELVLIQKRAVDAAQSIYDYNDRKAKMNLTDRADLLQSKASLESKRLDLKTAEDEETAATLAFNSYRNAPDEANPGKLAEISWDQLKSIAFPSQFQSRADTLAAEAQSRAAVANAKIQAERDKPNLNVFANYAFNGRDNSTSAALGNSWDSGRPTVSVGIKFSAPLNFGAVNEARKGAELNAIGSDAIYQQKLQDQSNQWNTLVIDLKNAQKRLELAIVIATAQKEKLDYERVRLRQGRTTTYQVLLFEQDYTAAEYARTNAAYQVLTLTSQIKLYQTTGARS
jgi:outer membrane protein TolC